VLTIYYALTFGLGLALAIPVAYWMQSKEIGAWGAILVTLSWNVLFVMILPLVLDWSERKHCKARFLELEEISGRNPELAAVISEHCKKLSIASLRLAVVDQPAEELFSYGLWGHNARLILPEQLLSVSEQGLAFPSIEAELTRFSSQDHTMIFLLFAIMQIVAELVIVWQI